MNVRRTLYRSGVPVALVFAAFTACERPDTAPLSLDPSSMTAAHAQQEKLTNDPEIARWLAGLKRATARFHDIDAAAAAGWGARITECMELPGAGAMGYHFANDTLIDGLPQQFAPELLVYEPTKNGGLRLVAVEYIVPYAAWEGATPPSLHGIDFHRNHAFGLWVLHAWVWKHNPEGMFEDWNPRASCQFANSTDR